jgi:3-isopropylmalate dehydrogenase
MNKKIAVLAGDGIGPEVVAQARRVLDKIAQKFGHEFEYKEALMGGIAIDETGEALPEKTLEICKSSDAILFGAIGDPKFDNDPTAKIRPEQGLLQLRKELGLYANIRPINTYAKLAEKSPLKQERLEGVDFVVIRELTGGIYFGEPRGRSEDGNRAFDTCVYNRYEIERIAQVAFEWASRRQKRITVVDKSNVLATSRLWKQVTQEFFAGKDVEVDYMYVDNAAMQIMLNPARFDVILTENMFGDILTDEASVIVGSLGMLPSASVGEKTSLYEPIHGSYPQAKGKNIANPIGTINSAALMLKMEFGMEEEYESIMKAINDVINQGYGTEDISDKPVSTTQLTDFILDKI